MEKWWKSGEKLEKVVKSGEKWRNVGKSSKVGISGESWGKSGEKWRKVGKSGDIFFAKWPPPAILDDQKSLSIAFLAISDQLANFIFGFCLENGHRPPFWKSLLGYFELPKITFDRISRHFRSIHNFFFFFFQNGRQRPFWKSDLRQKQ